jgi:hypothetical protein
VSRQDAENTIKENARLFVAGKETAEDFWQVFQSNLDDLCEALPLEGAYLSLSKSFERWKVSLPSDRKLAEEDVRTTAKQLDPHRLWRDEIAPRMKAEGQERKRRLSGREELVKRIEHLLFERDPIGINHGINPDEYRSEAETITLRSPDASTESELLQIIHEEFVKWFDESIAGPISKYEGITAEIWKLLHQTPTSSTS